jgi:hypothetical protein
LILNWAFIHTITLAKSAKNFTSPTLGQKLLAIQNAPVWSPTNGDLKVVAIMGYNSTKDGKLPPFLSGTQPRGDTFLKRCHLYIKAIPAKEKF